jgi:hypothetical protein
MHNKYHIFIIKNEAQSKDAKNPRLNLERKVLSMPLLIPDSGMKPVPIWRPAMLLLECVNHRGEMSRELCVQRVVNHHQMQFLSSQHMKVW